ncbi:serine hydrolase [uncultured Microbacterium sp.]|uniref:serine hydrolase domain-containing protein n=1 Tax=uncultured Microbacterium sp. TaxID=191216 RepID=UPI002609FA4F|nr:serine hydrolase domain-containing protein [uncultured Microbacterium sp.]
MTSPFVPLPAAAPSTEGTDAAGILRFIEAVEAHPDHEPHGLMILRRGRVIAQGWWAPYTRERRQLVYSLSKSFTSAAAGLLYDDGLLDLDRPVVSFFPEFADEITDPRSRGILVRHVASMATGHRDDMYDIAFGADPAEPVRGFLLHPPEEEPGSVFAYNQPATYTLAAIVQRLAGRRLVDLLRERVLDPIGAGELRWMQQPAGRDLGYSGSFMTTDTVARLGQLLLQRGEWAGRRILSEEWVRMATSPQVSTAGNWGNGPDSDWTQGYGFQHWMARHGFRGDGAWGQYCVVLPEHDAVVALQGQIPDMQGLLDLMWEHVLPAFGSAGTAEDDARLAAHLADAVLPAAAVDTAELSDADAAAWDGSEFVAARRGGADARVDRVGTGWRLVLTTAGGRVGAGFEPGRGWTVSDDAGPAVAVSGGFVSSTSLQLDLAFLETPHRLHVTLERPADDGDRIGEVTTRWETEPLHGADPATLTAPRD